MWYKVILVDKAARGRSCVTIRERLQEGYVRQWSFNDSRIAQGCQVWLDSKLNLIEHRMEYDNEVVGRRMAMRWPLGSTWDNLANE